MVATIVDGRAIAEEVLAGLALQVAALQVPLHMAAVCAGDDPGLHAFVRIKQKKAQSIGIECSAYYFSDDDEHGARASLQFLASDPSVHGIFVELPLPSAWDSTAMLSLIPASKDVDALASDAVIPPAVRALQYVFDAHNVTAKNCHAAVVGAGALVGKPVAQWLTHQGASVEVVDVGTLSPAQRVSSADIVIAATGKPGLVSGDWIREGATVIDYGYGRAGENYAGDVDSESVQKKAGLLTPVPGGMGPLVVAAALENLLILATR